MKKHAKFTFLIKLFVMFLAVVLLIGAVIMPQYTEIYVAAISDKRARAASIEEPKIMLVGISNVAFGFNSAMIEEEMDMPVVNMGLHGGLGLSFHVDMAKEYINPGDIVIIVPLSFMADPTVISDKPLMWATLEKNTDLWKDMTLTPEKTWELVKAYPIYLRKITDLWLTGQGNTDSGGIYARSNFNEYGDMQNLEDASIISSEPLEELKATSNAFASQDVSDEFAAYINETNAMVRDKGATLVLSSPAILKDVYPDLSLLPGLRQQIQEKIECPFISDFNNYLYPVEYFFDTGNHLNQVGMDVNSQNLIDDLQEYLAA